MSSEIALYFEFENKAAANRSCTNDATREKVKH